MTGTLRDRAYQGAASVSVVLLLLGLGAVLVDTFAGALPRLDLDFVRLPPSDAGRAGGVGPIVVSTLCILGVALAAAVPLALGAGVFLAELGGRRARPVRLSLELLAGVPSIVFGLFGNAFFCKVLGLGFSILSGGLTLACMVLPILVKATEEGVRAVPPEYRVGAAALGLSRGSYLWRIGLPQAMPLVVTGLVLGVGRALAETAALIFTSGYVDRWPESLQDSGRALSIHVYDLAMNVPGGDASAHASAAVLVLAILGVNAGVAALGRWARTR
ncbi:MAG: phosphate ABC transporter permease PstA [Deltaproteobacteria bacterium]|nr:phosphate ABC transporter permease PstA [Deltaproteobacteria bacterium]